MAYFLPVRLVYFLSGDIGLLSRFLLTLRDSWLLGVSSTCIELSMTIKNVVK